jgi:hypothetical protein
MITLEDYGLIYKEIEKLLTAYINFRGEIKDIPSKIEDLYQQCKDYIIGPPLAIIDYGVFSEGGKHIDICVPIKNTIELDNVSTKYIRNVEVLSKIHHGSLDNINLSFQDLANYFRIHGLPGTEWLRLIFHKCDEKKPESSEIEIQSGIHPWDKRLEFNLDRVLGEQARKEIMMGREELFTIHSSNEDRTQWIKNMLTRLDKSAKNYEKYEILSCCAHDFSRKRIDKLNSLYKKTRDIDKVLEVMHKDYAWYENPIREGNIIQVTKIPYNREGYDKAKTPDERKQNYCHCPLVRNHFDEGISPTFCNCSAGWYRQLWEGIIERPVKISILKSLIKGDQDCKFAITLPIN